MRQHTPQVKRSRLVALTLAGVLSMSALAACGGGGDATEQPKENKIAAGEVPDYYPAEYTDLIAEAKKEGGDLTIYSNTSEENWAPIFRDFKKKYSWVGKVSANDLDLSLIHI